MLDAVTGKVLAEWQPLEKKIKSDDKSIILFLPSPDGNSIACTVQEENRIVICDTVTGRTIRRFTCPDQKPWYRAFSPNGRLFAASTGGLTPSIHVWDIKSGEHVHQFKGHRGDISCLAFRKDSQRLASGGRDGTVLIWDLTKK